ncbi:hypothetical protein XENOCAPTIV_012531 [Xenoophorus captivus]|uniref:Uncharacterized protein n=1 Tax=Xenoophorus captivus TaxID=1517983 RepID=A0ABV0RH25_9TELE
MKADKWVCCPRPRMEEEVQSANHLNRTGFNHGLIKPRSSSSTHRCDFIAGISRKSKNSYYTSKALLCSTDMIYVVQTKSLDMVNKHDFFLNRVGKLPVFTLFKE